VETKRGLTEESIQQAMSDKFEMVLSNRYSNSFTIAREYYMLHDRMKAYSLI